MLLEFTLQNWLSFRDETTFSMVAGRERQHEERIAVLANPKTRVLPISALYGGNASGKSNLFFALSFVQNLIVRGTRPEQSIPVAPYLLDEESKNSPSSFGIQFVIGEIVYEYSFSATSKVIEKEQLSIIRGNSRSLLFSRDADKIILHGDFKKNKVLEFVSLGTRNNQLFLHNSVSQNQSVFKSVFDWFKSNLILISPEAKYGGIGSFFSKSHDRTELFSNLLRIIDTGITDIGYEEVSIESLQMPKQLQEEILSELSADNVIHIAPENDHYIISLESGKPVARRMVTEHKKKNGGTVAFNLQLESDGTLRVMDLLPAIIKLLEKESDVVIVIDEMDRSLHTLLVRKLIERYLSNCGEHTRSQLIFTTHDVLLMDQSLFRRDEMWLTERDCDGISSLYSVSEFKDIRFDKDLRKSYLQGRLGGIPRLNTILE